jgi:Na+-transporting NADH:ubiquinone oxidoreductase subunit NqrF
MHSSTDFQRRLLLIVIVFLLTVAITACGSNASKTNATSLPPSRSATPTMISTPGELTGCPSHVIVTTPPPPPSVLLTPSASKQLYVARIGDIIEVDLPFGEAWTGPIHLAGALLMQTPAGYAWGKTCIWRFLARSTGKEQLAYIGHALCKKDVACFFSVNEAAFTVVVK